MRPYTQPDFEKDIEVLRAQVKHDYNQMAILLKLPRRLDFLHACKAVLAGGLGMKDGSPYEKFKDDLFSTVASTIEKEDGLNDVLEILTGVWNHFPHDDLGGLSPIEKMRAEPPSSDMVSIDPSSLDMKEYMAEIDREVLSFSETVASNLLEYLKDIGLGKEEQQHILGILSDPHQKPDTAVLYLFTRMTNVATDRKQANQKSLTIDDIQPVARALMWCENYTASKMPNGHWNSRMFQNITEQAIEYNTRTVAKADAEIKPSAKTVLIVDPLRTFQALSMIHDTISEFSEEFNIDIGIEEATRHLVDWLALIDIHELLVQKDLNITTHYLFGAARLIAVTGDPKLSYKRLATRLRKEHKEIVSQVEFVAFDKEVKRIAEKVLNAVADPVMLMPYPGNEPHDYMERLAELAPDIKLRPSLNDDPPSIPSPFFP